METTAEQELPAGVVKDQDVAQGALDFALLGFDTVASLAESATLEVTDLSYGALRSIGVWPVFVTPVQAVQKGATVVIFRCMHLGVHALFGVASVGVKLVS